MESPQTPPPGRIANANANALMSRSHVTLEPAAPYDVGWMYVSNQGVPPPSPRCAF